MAVGHGVSICWIGQVHVCCCCRGAFSAVCAGERGDVDALAAARAGSAYAAASSSSTAKLSSQPSWRLNRLSYNGQTIETPSTSGCSVSPSMQPEPQTAPPERAVKRRLRVVRGLTPPPRPRDLPGRRRRPQRHAGYSSATVGFAEYPATARPRRAVVRRRRAHAVSGNRVPHIVVWLCVEKALEQTELVSSRLNLSLWW